MRHLRSYRLFEFDTSYEYPADPDKIRTILEELGVKNYTIAEDGRVGVNGSVVLRSHPMLIRMGRLPVKFLWATGYFDISGNNLRTLEGSPAVVGGEFDCAKNRLRDLDGAPKKVERLFDCSGNMLDSLRGGPEDVESFNCANNRLTDLVGSPTKVKFDFQCYSNDLRSLEGAPKKVGRSFDCSNNRLTSLKGAPEIGKNSGSFTCSNNRLESLEHSPKVVQGWFDCSNNRLISLEGGPEKVHFWFDCSNNRLTDLVGCPVHLGNFTCNDNNITSLRGAEVIRSTKRPSFDGNPVPDETLKELFKYMFVAKISYDEAIERFYKEGKLVRLKGFEKLDGIERFPDLRGRALGSKLGI